MGRSRLEKFESENDDSDSGSDSSRSRSRSGSARSGSAASRKSGSPASRKSGSPASRKSGSPASRKSGSPASRKSGSPASRKSGSASPARSASGSPARSGSRSPARSGSGSPAKSVSPAGSNRSGSGSQARSRSKSKTPADESEKSATPAMSKSRSQSRSRSRSKSGSPARSQSGSPSRSKTGSPGPAKKDDSDSDVEAPKKRKHGSGSDSGSDIESKKKPKAGTVTPKSDASDSEKVGAEDLFGDDLSVSSEDEDDKKSKKKVIDDSDGDDVQRYDDDDSNKKKSLDSDSDDEIQKAAKANKKPYDDKPDEDQIPETRIDVEVPKINTDLGRDIHFVKLPNFLSVESRPFDAETYEDEMDEDQNQQDEEGRTRLKLKVENTIRWRQGFDKEGNAIKESNARIVKWSDGSFSLHLGSEIFDVHKQPLQSDFNHLFIRQGTGLQGQAVFKTKLSFRPHSTDSQTHKKMTLSMADRSSKSNQIKVISQVGVDPEANRWERMKKEEQGLREAMRKDASKKRVREKGSSKGLSGGYLEDGDDSDNDAAFSIAAIKAKYKPGGAQPKKKPIYSSDDDSDLESKKGKKLEKAKGVDSDSDSARSI